MCVDACAITDKTIPNNKRSILITNNIVNIKYVSVIWLGK
jgi:hypothetical protein